MAILIRWLVPAILIPALLFSAAGRWDLPLLWVYVLLWQACALATVVIVFKTDPSLFQERFRPGPGGQDPLLRFLGLPVMVSHLVVAGLDVGRFHWSGTLPPGVQAAGLVGFTAGLSVVLWGVAVNRFFSSEARIQRDRGHVLITAGPYQFLRHPAYLGMIVATLSSAPALGSWWALLPPLLMVFLLIRRTAVEDRLLRQELEGYGGYAEKVRYRLVPGVW